MKEDQFLFFMKVESSNSKYQTKTLYINNSETFLGVFRQLVWLSPPTILHVET